MRQATEVGQARGAVLSAVVDGNGTMAQLRPVWTIPTVGPSGFFASLTPTRMTGWIVAALLGAVCVVLAIRVLTHRARRKQRGLLGSWPLRRIRLAELDPVFIPGPFGPTVSTEVSFIGRGPMHVPGGTSDGESWILAVLAKRATCLFEFGTCTGKTAYLWSRNASEHASIITLTLAPSQQHQYVKGPLDTQEDTRFALSESAFESFLYSGTPAADRVTQLYGDSKQFDETPYLDWADLVFVDGSHARSYVESDSAKAMRMVKPGGLVLWHDYAGHGHAPGVFAALNALATTVPLCLVEGTTFAMWRRPLFTPHSTTPPFRAI